MSDLITINTRTTNVTAYRELLEARGVPILRDWQEDANHIFVIPSGYKNQLETTLSPGQQNAMLQNVTQKEQQDAFRKAALASGTGMSVAEVNPETGTLEGYETYTPTAKITASTPESPFKDSATKSAIEAGFKQEIVQPTPEKAKPYVYDIYVDYPEQAIDIQNWAKTIPGVSADRVADSSEKGIKIQISSEKPLTKANPITGSEWIYPYNQPQTRSEKQIKAERAGVESKGLAERAYQGAHPWEKIALGLHTMLTPKGDEQLGAAFRGGDASKIVKERLAYEIAKPLPEITNYVPTDLEKGIKGFAIKASIPSTVTKSDYALDFLQSPVFEVEASYLVGAGGALAVTTKTGALVAGSKFGKTALTGLAIASTGGMVLDVGTSALSGNTAEAVGKGLTGIVSLAAGIKGFKSQYSYSVSNVQPSYVKLEDQRIRGVSTTLEYSNQKLSQGEFEITEGKLKGLKGVTHQTTNPKKGRGFLITEIPEQKLPSGQKIKAQGSTRYVENLPDITVPKEPEPIRIFRRSSNEMKMMVDDVFAKIVGPKKSEMYLQKVAENKIPMKGGNDLVVRRFSGVAQENEAGKYRLTVLKNQKSVLVEESVISKKTLAKIDWVDMEVKSSQVDDIVRSAKFNEPSFKEPSIPKDISPGLKLKEPKPRLKSEMSELPPIPSGAVRVEPKISFIPAVSGLVSRAFVKPIQDISLKLESRQKVLPKQAISLESKQRISPKVVSGAVQLTMKVPEAQKLADIQTQKLKVVELAAQTPVTAQIQLQKQVVTERITPLKKLDVMPPIPPTVDVPVDIPPIRIPGMPLPFYGLGSGRARRTGRNVIKNPIPELEEIMKIKINLKGVV